MTVYIVGGSNSLKKDGWTSRFRVHVPDFVNLSIGATTSITGLFRLLTTPEIGAGDVVVWEYALNEANHINRGAQPKILLGHFEHLLRFAREKGLKVAPVIFTPRRLEEKPARSAYYRRLFKLLNDYGLEPFDMSSAYRAKLGVARLPRSVYRDPSHYAHTDDVLDFIATGVASAVQNAQIPELISPLIVGRERLKLIDSFADETFENSIMRVAVASPPFTFPLSDHGQVAAVCFFTSPTDDAFEISVATGRRAKAMPVSAARKGKDKKPLFKSLIVPQGRSYEMSTAPNGMIWINPWSGQGRIAAPVGCRKKLASRSSQTSARIAGVFIATHPWWARYLNAPKAMRGKLSRLRQRWRR